MLGRYADQFFAKQARETVLAGQPNGEAGTIAFPDREQAGTGQVAHVSGQYEMPGPQNVTSGNDMLPGMGQEADMLPGMGQEADMLPGMGQMGKIVPVALMAGAGLLLLGFLGSKSKPPTRKRRRRASRRRMPKRDSMGRFISA